MSSSDASFDSSSDSETAETEVEYDLEVEVISNASKQKDTWDDDEPEDVYANKPLADENWKLTHFFLCLRFSASSVRWKGIRWRDMPLSLFGLLLHPKTMHLSGIFFFSTEAKIVPNSGLSVGFWVGGSIHKVGSYFHFISPISHSKLTY